MNASVFVRGPSGGGDDAISAVYVDGVVCAMNRMPAVAGYTGLSSASCALPAGSHYIDLVVFGSTGIATKAGSYMRGGVVSF